ncbi:MAG TPA: bifunctional oligoribonuclease/PAP phosphatase NrnA [Bacillota bacterium]|nr:bifunctional oligoribonuclease/PAP phosphatase NrnA [Bacillota bacterium]
MKNQIQKFFDLIQAHNRFLIGCHVHPDGDAIGSLLAVGLYLKNIGKQVEMVCSEGVPTVYRFLEGSSLIKTSIESDYQPEVLICVDCAEKDRTALPREVWEISGLIVVNLDHHITNTGFGDLSIIDSQAAATGELIFRILQQGGTLNAPIATALYTAIATDTGFFRYDSTSAYTLETVSGLVKDYQVKPAKIAEQVHEQKSYNSIRLLGEILSNLQLGLGGKVAWIVLDQTLLNKYPVENEETESYVNYARSIEGVEIGILFKELKPNDFKISWRSTEAVDVSKLAGYFGGGGHARAAGCSITGTVELVVQTVLDFVAGYYQK